MKRKTYWIDEYKKTKPQFNKVEKIIRSFLLNAADSVSFKILEYRDLFPPRKYGTEDDPKFIQFTEKIKTSFIKKKITKEKFIFFTFRNRTYFYKLTQQLKKLLNKHTLLWFNVVGGDFYCFENPTFYKGKTVIAEVLQHERGTVLHLIEKEKRQLEKNGIKLTQVLR